MDTLRRRILPPVLAAVLAGALVACQPPAEFPAGFTDTDLWEFTDIRVDTEVPNQYPNGTTRGQPADAGHGEEDDAAH